MTIFYWYVAVACLWTTLLALNISRLRMREKIGIGDGGKLPLKRAIRAHINMVEHLVPFTFLLFALVSLAPDNNMLCVLVVGFLASRLLHALSFLASGSLLRQASASITYLCEVVCGVLVIMQLV